MIYTDNLFNLHNNWELNIAPMTHGNCKFSIPPHE